MAMILKKITWTDIASGSKWMDVIEAAKWGKEKYDVDYVSIGYVIHKTKRFIVIAATYDSSDDSYNDISMIPTSVIKRIEILRKN
jgi:hypothetical protein